MNDLGYICIHLLTRSCACVHCPGCIVDSFCTTQVYIVLRLFPLCVATNHDRVVISLDSYTGDLVSSLVCHTNSSNSCLNWRVLLKPISQKATFNCACVSIRIKSGEPGFPGFSVPGRLGGVICKPKVM